METIRRFSALCVARDVPPPVPDEKTEALLRRLGDGLLPEHLPEKRFHALLRLYQYFALRCGEALPFPENAKIGRYNYEPYLIYRIGGYVTSCYDGGCCDEDYIHTYLRFEREEFPPAWDSLKKSSMRVASDQALFDGLRAFWSFRGALDEDCPAALTREGLWLMNPFGLSGVYRLSYFQS